MSEWIGIEEFAQLVGYHPSWVRNLIKMGEIPTENVRQENGRRWINTCEVERIKARKKKMDLEQKKIAPDNLVEYDGFLLTPDEIIRLEEVRAKNGFWATDNANHERIEERILKSELEDMRKRNRQ